MESALSTQKLLYQLSPSKYPLFALLQQNVSEDMLREIAMADYGQEAEQHLSALQAFQWEKQQTALNYWHPCEVLELTRWMEVEEKSWSCNTKRLRQHWIRLYACTILLWNTALPNNSGADLGEVSTVIVFVESAIALGKPAAQAGLQFMTWRLLNFLDNDWELGDEPHFPLAVLLLYVWLGDCNKAVIQALTQMTQGSTQELFHGCLRSQLWRETVNEILIQPSRRTTSEIKGQLSAFGRSLIEASDR